MKCAKWIKCSLLMLVVFLSVAGDDAWARRRGHSRVGVHLGLGVPMFRSSYHHHRPVAYRSAFYPTFYASYPYYSSWTPYPSYGAPVVINNAPPVYVERAVPSVPPPESAEASYWYYCSASRGYYPYVARCPSGWQKVPSRPVDIQ